MRISCPKEAIQCTRCQGLMVNDWCVTSAPPEKISVKRCVNCGDIIDQRILDNRQLPSLTDEEQTNPQLGSHTYPPIPMTPKRMRGRAA